MANVIRSRFYSVLALVFGAVIIAGFTRTYYLRPFFDLPTLSTLLQLHGFVFSAWLLLFVVQTRLIAGRNYRLHQNVGIAGMVLAGLVVAIGVYVALVGAPTPRPRPMGFTGMQFLIFPLTAIAFFAACVGGALALRKRAALHKRLMVLGMIAVMGPAVARLIRLAGPTEYFLAIQTAVAAAFVAWVLIHDWIKYRLVEPVFAVGGLLLVLSWPARAALARTDTWVAIAHLLTGWAGPATVA